MARETVTEMENVFDRERRKFPSNAHRIAWYLGASILPFREVIPKGLSLDDSKDLPLGEKSLHEFFYALYTDMYQNPGDYLMKETPDLFFNDGEWYKARPDMTRARGTNAHVMKSLEVLYEIGRRAVRDGDRLVLSTSEYDRILAEIRPTSISKPKVRGLLTALHKFGLGISGNSQVVIQATRYPKMLVAIKALCQHGGQDDRQVRFFAFHRCDFRAVEESYTPDLSQVFSILPKGARELVDRIIAYMTGSGYRMELQMGGYPSAVWNVKFSGNKRYKTSDFFWFGFSIEYLNRFYVELHCMNPQYLIPIVYRKGPEYTEWFDRTWNHDCTHCGYCKSRFRNPGPYVFEHSGKKRELCHQCWLGARNPTQEQVDSLLKMVALHTEAGMAAQPRAERDEPRSMVTHAANVARCPPDESANDEEDHG